VDSAQRPTEPRGAPVLDRPRLLNLLGTGRPGSGSALIWGPSGSGKSVLVHEYADTVALQAPAAVVSLTAAEADPLARWEAIDAARPTSSPPGATRRARR
jgi:ATP/maltotriose-dependent transcriptional regulator MalT